MTILNNAVTNTVRNYVELESEKLGLTNASIDEMGNIDFYDIDFGDSCAGEAITESDLLNNLPSVFDQEELAYHIDTVAILEDEKEQLHFCLKEYMLLERSQEVSLEEIKKIISEEYERLSLSFSATMSDQGNDITHLINGDY
jgi:hypothetical protein